MAELTPMMAQYLRIKEDHRDSVLFFRLGDFYEMFNEDAKEVSRLLNLTLTQRAGTPMCGIPYHASKIYIARLLRLGKKIAICEQVSIPSSSKGLVDRKVTEIITPGTVLEDDFLEQKSNNFLASIALVHSSSEDLLSFAYIDISTGEFAASSFNLDQAEERLKKELGRLQVREILVQQSLFSHFPIIDRIFDEYPSLFINKYPDWSFNQTTAWKRLCSALGTESLQAFSLYPNSPELVTASLLLEYLEQTGQTNFGHLQGISVYSDSEFVSIDDASQKNLELLTNLRDSSQAYSLYAVLDQTRTASGARLLRNWITHPLIQTARIQERTTKVDFFYRNQKILSQIRQNLSSILDIQRLSSRIAAKKAHAKDLTALSISLQTYINLSHILNEISSCPFTFSSVSLTVAENIAKLIHDSILEDAPIVLNEGGIICPLWSSKLDELKTLKNNSTEVLEAYLNKEREETGISNLKIKYTRMLGYYIEVSKGRLDAVPEHFIRRRSLVNGDRFTTDRLVELETELNNVDSHIIELEQKLFIEIRDQTAQHLSVFYEIAQNIAQIDVLQSYAWAATVYAWTKPQFNEVSLIDIVDGRHPVVEQHLGTNEFVPNSIALSTKDPSVPLFALITGPNMAGKSTFLRQTALIVLMAQIGSFVPASEANISAVDKIFCRVGASDNLARGESTFLVEMIETAHILRNATTESLIIMDEVGRGTSTEDGLSLAQAITEYILEKVKSKTLFATHYHELSHLSTQGLANFCLDVLEIQGKIVFLKKIKKGASDNSYGIHVARLAGIPEPVLQRAQMLLQDLTSKKNIHEENLSTQKKEALPQFQPSLFSEEELVLEELLSIDLNTTTPLSALSLLNTWKSRLRP